MSDHSRSVSHRRFGRPGLRQATLILPKTGERVKRAFTLRASADGEADDRTPLLRRPSDDSDDENFTEWRGSLAGRVLQHCSDFVRSKLGKNIFKCSIAYLIGSLATFLPPVSAFLGHNDGKHMVATITVYFHSARSAGSMAEATICGLVAFIYAAVLSFTSMGVSVFFGSQDLITLGHILVLIIFCGGGLGFVAWTKQKLENPLVNVACSLASLALITILTKEGSIQAARFSYEKIYQVLKMVIMGIIASTVVSLLVFPVSARKEFQEDLRKATDSLGDMIKMVTDSFLYGTEEVMNGSTYREASAKYKTIYSSVKKNRREAKYEHYILGTEKEYRLLSQLTKCLERLALDINGLRSAATTQFGLIDKPAFSTSSPFSESALSSPATARHMSHPVDLGKFDRRIVALASIDEEVEGDSHDEETPNGTDGTGVESPKNFFSAPNGSQSASTPAAMFLVFIEHLGPPMKSLVYTLGVVLDELPFGPGPEYRITVNSNFRSSLVDAADLYNHRRREAQTLVYQSISPNKTKGVDVLADFEEVAASCGYFSANLEDFAKGMISYLDILEELGQEVERSPRRRSWNWLLFWRRPDEKNTATDSANPPSAIEQNPERALSEVVPIRPKSRKDNSVLEVPMSKTTYTYRLWRLLRFFRRDDIKYAMKVGVGAILYAMWSFIPSTRPFYSRWRGEWGLLSYMLVCSMTIGASNTTGWQRFFGTCIGAVCAILAWIAAHENPFVLGFFGWFVSLFCFYIIVGQGQGPKGRYILLTYNLSALYAYSLSAKDDDDDNDEGGVSPEIWQIVLHRVVAVMVGCVWGIIITRLIWPVSARQKLKDGLCILWLRMGLIWKRDPLTVLVDGASGNSYMDIRESIALRRYLTHLETLRNSAAFEFELRGPFPNEILTRTLQATSRMLSAFHAMNTVITRDMKATPGETALLKYTSHERMQLSSRISHLFSVLASSMKLEYPLNDAMPKIEQRRDQLLAKVFDFKQNSPDAHLASDDDYELLYAYALVTGQLAEDIAAVGQEVEQLYGVMNEEDFKLD